MGSPGMSSEFGYRRPGEETAGTRRSGHPSGGTGGSSHHLSEDRDDRPGDMAATPSGGVSGGRPSPLRIRSVNPELPLEGRLREVREAAFEAFARTGNWVVFYREILGVSGVCRRAFPESGDWDRFLASDVHRDLQEMLAALRGQDLDKAMAAEPEKMITIRLPASLHKSLHMEAKAANLSLNKLCISKLLQAIDGRFVPDHRGGIPGPKMIERVVTGQ